jgi:hypothetical protein
MTQLTGPQSPQKDPWQAVVIVALCSFFLALTCCGGGSVLASYWNRSSSKFLSALASFLFSLGYVFLLVFVVTILVALGGAIFVAIRRH